MRISGYTWAANAKGKLFPYEACIRSLLLLADEACVAFDPRHDLAETFTKIDPRVKTIEHLCCVESIYGRGEQLTEARKACTGDWLIWLDLDEVIHEKDVPVIQDLLYYAQAHNYAGVALGLLNFYMKNYFHNQSIYWDQGLPRFTKNIDGVIHGVGVDALRQGPSGIQQLAFGDCVNFVKDGYNHKVAPVLYFRDYGFFAKLDAGKAIEEDIAVTVSRFPYIYHYSRYSVQRKVKMGSDASVNYFMGAMQDYQPDLWARNLAEFVVLEQKQETPAGGFLGPVALQHPQAIAAWIGSIDNMTGKG